MKHYNKIYYHLSDIPGYNPDKINNDFFYIKIENYMNNGKDVYLKCSKDEAYKYRNFERNYKRKEYSYKKHIENNCTSLDYLLEEKKDQNKKQKLSNILPYIVDKSSEDSLFIEMAINRIKKYGDNLDLKILGKIFDGEISTSKISKQLNISRTTIQSRIKKMQEIFKDVKSN